MCLSRTTKPQGHYHSRGFLNKIGAQFFPWPSELSTLINLLLKQANWLMICYALLALGSITAIVALWKINKSDSLICPKTLNVFRYIWHLFHLSTTKTRNPWGLYSFSKSNIAPNFICWVEITTVNYIPVRAKYPRCLESACPWFSLW